MNKIVIGACMALFYLSSVAASFDDEQTHRLITLRSSDVKISLLNKYLAEVMNLPDGTATLLLGQNVAWWLSEGSYLEDSPPCRASNHFHDPLKPWDSSQASDFPMPFSLYCYSEGFLPRHSAVTWATGYTSPAPTGQKASFLLMKPNERLGSDLNIEIRAPWLLFILQFSLLTFLVCSETVSTDRLDLNEKVDEMISG